MTQKNLWTRLRLEIGSLASWRYQSKRRFGPKFEPAHRIDVPEIGLEDIDAYFYIHLGHHYVVFPGFSLYRFLKKDKRYYTR